MTVEKNVIGLLGLSEALSRERAGTLKGWTLSQNRIISVGLSKSSKGLLPELVSVVKNMKRCSKTVAIRELQTENHEIKMTSLSE